MEREEITRAIRDLMPELRKLGVTKISLFGSFINGQAREASDVDLLAEFARPHTSRQYFDTLFLLEDALGRTVDLAEPGALHPLIRGRVLAEAVQVA